MGGLRSLLSRLWWSLTGRRGAAQLDDEIRFHIEMEIQRNLEQGLQLDEARRQALRGFGGVEATRIRFREQKGLPLIDTTLQDIRYGVRMLLKNRVFTVVAVLTLALGIGANTAIFSVVNSVLLEPLPYDGGDRIVMVWEDFSDLGGPAQEWIEVPNLYEWRKSGVWESLSAFGFGSANLTSTGEPEQLSRGAVTYDFLTTFGVTPAAGRNFTEADDMPGAAPVAIISHGLWQRAFGGAHLLGSAIQVSGVETTVIGVLPEDFQLVGVPPVDIWTPLRLDPARQNRGSFFLQGVGRLKEGVPLARAQAEMDVIMERIGAEYEIDRGVGVSLVPLLEQLVSPVETGLWILLGIVGFVLLIACANIANLMLSRGAARGRELSIRSAMGASRLRLIRQLLTESVILALAGAALGLVLADWVTRALISRAPAGVAPRLDSAQLDTTVLLFTLAVSVLAGLAFGLAPALQSRRQDIRQGLHDAGRGSAAAASGTRLRSVLAAGQVALALCLLVAAGLAIRSFQSLMNVDPGFRPAGLVTTRLSMPSGSYSGGPELVNFMDSLLERLSARPEIEVATAASQLPLGGADSDTSFQIEGRPEPANPQEVPAIWYRRVSPDYFQTLGIPLLRGRAFTEGDHSTAPRAVLINEMAARRFWPGEDAIGRRVRFGDGQWHTIVGIVGNVLYRALDREAPAALYFPFSQRPGRGMNLLIKSDADPSAVSRVVRAALRQLDPQMPIASVVTLDSMVETSVAQPRFFKDLTTAFGLLALVLAAVGIYGVTAYAVSLRRAELGVRMALGAGRGDVLALILRQGLAMTAAGVAAGLLLALWATRLMASLLFEVTPGDGVTFAAAVAVLLLAGFAACLFPGLRATRIDPLLALRVD